MKWEKLGRIYDPKKDSSVFKGKMSHGANPVPLLLHDDVYRIFFNVRDEQSRSYLTYLDYDIVKRVIVSFPGKLLLSPGVQGTFDDCGCSLGSILDLGDKCYFYYLGWNIPRNLPFMNSIGMAVYDKDSDSCTKISRGPIMGRCDVDPFSISYPFVMKKDNVYQMWYGANLDWRDTTLDKYNFLYGLKYASSQDGIHFQREGIICIQGDGVIDSVFARPTVLYEDGIYRMWYTYRGEQYRIGYAESEDGIAWTRKDSEAGIEPSGSEWEDGEISYPMVFRHKGTLYMLHCGKRYGLTGFGLARQADE